MVRNQLGFSSVRMWARMAVLNVSRHTFQSPFGMQQNPPMPVREASVAPIHVGGCYIPHRDWHVRRLTFSTAIRAHILIDEIPNGLITINDLKLAAYISHLHLFAPRMAPLEHISTGIDNIATESWDCWGSVSTATAIGPLL